MSKFFIAALIAIVVAAEPANALTKKAENALKFVGQAQAFSEMCPMLSLNAMAAGRLLSSSKVDVDSFENESSDEFAAMISGYRTAKDNFKDKDMETICLGGALLFGNDGQAVRGLLAH